MKPPFVAVGMLLLRATQITSHLILVTQTSNDPLSPNTGNIPVFNTVEIMNPISDHIFLFALVARKQSIFISLSVL